VSAIFDLGTVVISRSERRQPVRRRPLVVEVIGATGTGKSSLCRALHQRDATIHSGLEIWRLPHSWLLANGLLRMPTLLQCWHSCGRSCWEEMNHIVRLHALSWWLSLESSRGYRILPLQEGAVYVLAWLYAFGHEGARRGCMERWWRVALERWAATLDVIVWLDAPDALLAQRIRTRWGTHPYADWEDQPLYEFFAQWRSGYQYVVSQLIEAGGAKVMNIATDQEPIGRLADTILTNLNGTLSVS
jgi:hypothetical protein